MTFIRKALVTAILTGTAVWVAGCGGTSGATTGGTSEPAPPVDGGDSTTDTTTVSGPITGFGSVIVNGVHFDTDAAQILHDGEPITEDDLKVGMIINLSGAVDGDGVNGSAVQIEFDEELKGPVSSVDLASNSFVVLGQTVVIDSETAFDNLDLETLAAGDFVEISGFFDAAGALRATLVEREDSHAGDYSDVELKGVIRALDATANRFMLGAQSVDYSAAEFDDIPDNTLVDGLFVEVKASGLSEDGVLLAREIEYEEREDDEAEEGREFELEGLVTALTSATEIAINGRSVLLTAETEFEEGTAADLTLNSKIKAEGEINADGVLVAEKIELRRRGSLEVESIINSINLENSSLTVFGIDVMVTPSTRWEDDSEAEERYFDLADLNPGDSLEIKGYQNAEGQFIATAIERQDADEEQEHSFTGPVASIENGVLNILGVNLVLGADLEPEDAAEMSSLIASLAVGDLISVEGVLSADNQLSILELELEEDDGRNEFGGDRRNEDDQESEEDADSDEAEEPEENSEESEEPEEIEDSEVEV